MSSTKNDIMDNQGLHNLNYKSIIDLDIIPENLVISTMTIICYFNTKFIAENIFDHIELNRDNILTVKYNGKIKTIIEKKKKKKRKKKKEFFNQITIIVNTINNKEINCKLFKNGSIQVTGCKNVLHFITAIKKICEALKKNDNAIINLENDILVVENKPFYTNEYSLNYFYNEDTKYLQTNLVKKLNKLIQSDSDVNDDNIITVPVQNVNTLVTNESKTKKKINLGIKYNEHYIKNNSDLKKKKLDKIIDSFPLLMITNNENFKYGHIYKKSLNDINDIQHFINKYINNNRGNEIININLVKEFKIVMINSNFNIGFEINRAKLFKIMQDKEITASFEPCTHACVNIKYMYKKDTLYEKKISIFVFESGSIIITGANNTEHILEGYKFINNILYENKNEIILQDINNYLNHPELLKILNKNDLY
jgi:TATA-box binding protein (TBP) (component of TFIID and TFIIIB)